MRAASLRREARWEHIGLKRGRMPVEHIQVINVIASWDEDAGVWWARSDDLPGLAAEGENIGELEDRLRAIIPDLIEANDVSTGNAPDVPVIVRATSEIRVALHA